MITARARAQREGRRNLCVINAPKLSAPRSRWCRSLDSSPPSWSQDRGEIPNRRRATRLDQAAKEVLVIVMRWLRGAAALALCATLSAAGPAQAQGVVKNTFGDWQLRCETPAGAQSEQCAVVQNVAAEDRPNVSLVIIVLKTADRKSHLLRVIAPLEAGVLLPAGLGLKVDQTDIGRAGF